MSTYRLTIFPYLGYRGVTHLWGKVYCWNYYDACNEYIHDPILRSEVTRAIEVDEHPEWVNVLWEGDDVTGRTISSNHQIRKVQLLLMFCTIARGNVYQDDKLWSSSDHFSFTSLRVIAGSTKFEYKLNPIFKRLKQSFPLRKGAIQTPKHIALRTPNNAKFDEELLSALMKLEKKNHGQMSRIYNALEMLFSVMINSNLTPNSTILIILVAAFENLFISDRRGVKGELDRVYLGSKKYRNKYENRTGQLQPDIPHTSIAIWYEHLCRARNRVTHGKEILQKHASYGPQSHRYIALLVLISCVKHILANEIGISLSGHVIRFKARDGKLWFEYRK